MLATLSESVHSTHDSLNTLCRVVVCSVSAVVAWLFFTLQGFIVLIPAVAQRHVCRLLVGSANTCHKFYHTCSPGTHMFVKFHHRVFWIGGVWRSTQISWRSKLLEEYLFRFVTELASRSATSSYRFIVK